MIAEQDDLELTPRTARILVVDDVATNRELVKAALESGPFIVREAVDGEAALKEIEAHDFDLVLLDVSMPGMDGIEVVTVLRKKIGRTELPVLMLTSHDGSDEVVAALQAGANDYLIKPFDPEVLLARIDVHLANKRFGEELREARRSAEDANRAKSDFLARMSHELRTPLNAIIGYSEMLEEEMEDLGEESAVSDLQRIHAAGTHLLGLINDILDLSKIEAGKMELNPETFDLCAALGEVVTTLSPLAAKNGNEVHLACPADIGEMYQDTMKVKQILFNLLSNASKFTENGDITITVSAGDTDGVDTVRFDVRDTGIGMTPEQVGNLFQDFAQADKTIAKSYGGTGLGLALVKRFSEMMGGGATAESEVGEGSVFSVRLPRVMSEDEDMSSVEVARLKLSQENEVSKTPEWETYEGPKVLVVDDDPFVLDLMHRALTREGYLVAVASGGEDAIAKATELKPDVITLDIIMPDRDGWSVLATLKNDPATCHIPVIMCSILDDTRRGFALGASEYLIKPVDRRLLIRKLERFKQGATTGTVLVIEDTDETRDLLSRALSKGGWEVVGAENGMHAMALLEDFQPDLIVLDLMMPEMDGFEVIERLQGSEQWNQIPVVVCTAKDLSSEEKALLEGAVSNVVLKGGDGIEQLLGEIAAATDSCRPSGSAAQTG